MGNKSSKKTKYLVSPNAERPSCPGPPYAEIQDNGVYLEWSCPDSDGGCPVIGYIVQHLEVREGIWLSSSPIPSTECLIHNLIEGEIYKFRVIAENLIGYSPPSSCSDPIIYTQELTAPFFLSSPTDVTAFENEQIEFYAQVVGRPQPNIKWYINDYDMESNKNISIMGQKLLIHKVTEAIEGEVKCRAHNESGSAEVTFSLRVGASPRVLDESFRELFFRVDEILRIKFTFSGRPQPHVTWFHNGTQITEDEFIETTSQFSVLRIANAGREHRGEYSIRLKNNLGSDTGAVLVTVADTPKPPQKPSVILLDDNSCSLEWTDGSDDGGCPILCYVIEYFRVGWDVWLTALNSKKKTAKVHELIPGSRYKFRIKAENLYGQSLPSEESVDLLIPDISSKIMGPVLNDDEENKNLFIDKSETKSLQSPISSQSFSMETTQTNYNDQNYEIRTKKSHTKNDKEDMLNGHIKEVSISNEDQFSKNLKSDHEKSSGNFHNKATNQISTNLKKLINDTDEEMSNIISNSSKYIQNQDSSHNQMSSSTSMAFTKIVNKKTNDNDEKEIIIPSSDNAQLQNSQTSLITTTNKNFNSNSIISNLNLYNSDILKVSHKENQDTQSRSRQKSPTLYDHYNTKTRSISRPRSSCASSNESLTSNNSLESFRAQSKISNFKPWNRKHDNVDNDTEEIKNIENDKSFYQSTPALTSNSTLDKNSRIGNSLSHLIFEGSGSDTSEDDSKMITCSSLLVFKSGNCKIKTLSRENLNKNLISSSSESHSKNSLNSENYEYYASIFSKTFQNNYDENSDTANVIRKLEISSEQDEKIENKTNIPKIMLYWKDFIKSVKNFKIIYSFTFIGGAILLVKYNFYVCIIIMIFVVYTLIRTLFE